MSGSKYYWFDITDDSIDLPDDYNAFLNEYWIDATTDTTANVVVISITDFTEQQGNQLYLYSPERVVEYRYDYGENMTKKYLVIGYIDESDLLLSLEDYKIYGLVEETDPQNGFIIAQTFTRLMNGHYKTIAESKRQLTNNFPWEDYVYKDKY